MNTVNKEIKGKSQRIWGWILAIAGGLFTLLGILSFMMMVGADDHEIYQLGFFCFPLFLVIGVPSLILCTYLMTHKEKVESRRIWGWILVILGVWFILLSMWSSVAGFLMYEQQVDISIWNLLIMVSGIVLLFPGIWLITRKGKMRPATLGSLDNPQG